MNPCPKCVFEWYDLKHDTSCKDECREYKAWSSIDRLLDKLEQASDETLDELAKSGVIKVVQHEPS